ncbi:MAG: hypothetical protein K2P81_02315 [Bacteriovoracaceae bacterium]|nr:hypothetical protein [Bacteriovoracaceae bacterium]
MRILLSLILISLSIEAMASNATEYPVCLREKKIVEFKILARELSTDEVQQILDQQASSQEFKKVKDSNSRVACNCDTTNPGLQDLISFIESDFRKLQYSLLTRSSASEIQEAKSKAQIAFYECQNRERRTHLDLLALSKAAYTEPFPAGSKNMLDGFKGLFGNNFNIEGLKGFTKDSVIDGKNTRTFAFAGTQTGLDWLANIGSKGGSQLKLANRLMLQDAVSYVKSGGHIRCTGHSLGGGLAESFCSAVMMEVRKTVPNFGDFQKDDRIKIVTFNGLGGIGPYRDALGSNAPLPSGLSWLASSAVHYRVQGDPLAMIPNNPHITGTVFETRSERKVIRTGSRTEAAINNTASAVAVTTGSILDSLQGKTPIQRNVAQDSADLCYASDDPLGAHDLTTCSSIVKMNENFTRNQSLVRNQPIF